MASRIGLTAPWAAHPILLLRSQAKFLPVRALAMSGDASEYERGLKALSSLISGRQRADGKNWSHAFELMKVHLEVRVLLCPTLSLRWKAWVVGHSRFPASFQRLGLQEELPKLSVIHVAGTKGKGSTCSMVESVLRKCGYRTGLFTSPHLVDVRERVRINGWVPGRAEGADHAVPPGAPCRWAGPLLGE